MSDVNDTVLYARRVILGPGGTGSLEGILGDAFDRIRRTLEWDMNGSE
jgi:hypothetical protein